MSQDKISNIEGDTLSDSSPGMSTQHRQYFEYAGVDHKVCLISPTSTHISSVHVKAKLLDIPIEEFIKVHGDVEMLHIFVYIVAKTSMGSSTLLCAADRIPWMRSITRSLILWLVANVRKTPQLPK